MDIFLILFIAVIGVHDAAHQGMAHHIQGCEVDEGDILYALQYPLCGIKPGNRAVKQILLGLVAGYHHL